MVESNPEADRLMEENIRKMEEEARLVLQVPVSTLFYPFLLGLIGLDAPRKLKEKAD